MISIIALILGFLCGRLFKKQPTQVLTKTETHTEIAQKQEVSTQATVQKDSTLSLKTSYSEKFFNKQGILTRQIDYGYIKAETAQIEGSKRFTEVNDIKSNTQSFTTTSQIYGSSLYLGLNVPTSDFKNPSNIVSKPEEINFMLEYRPFESINFFFESNYKFETQIGFIIALN